MVSKHGMRNAIRRAEDAREASRSGVSPSALARSRALIARRPDPVAEQAAELGNRVIAEAMANGETEDAAYEKGMRAGVDFYLNAPPEGTDSRGETW